MSLFDQSNTSSSDEETERFVEIQLKLSKIYINYLQLYNYSRFVRDSYSKKDFKERFSNDIQAFQNQNEDVEETNINNYFKCINEQTFTVSNDEFIDFYKLSEFLQIKTFKKKLKSYLCSHTTDINFIITTMLHENIETNDNQNNPSNLFKMLNESLKHKVNECLQNENFKKFKISQIYHILESSSEKISSDLLYSFINQSIENYHILFIFLDIENLSDDNFQELYDNYTRSLNTKENVYYKSISCSMAYIFK